MRLFIALPILNAESIVEQAQLLKMKGISVNKNPHITLKFLGESEPDSIIEALQDVKVPSFSVHTTGIGFFPNPSRPWVVWIGVEPKEPLIGLRKKIDTVLEDLFQKDVSFKPHVTLCRIKPGLNPEELQSKIATMQVPQITFQVNKFYLMKSILSPKGATHEVVHEFTLA